MARSRAPDLALDLGTARLRLASRAGGVVADLPSVVALRGREVVAVGEPALRLRGRAEAGVSVVRPIRGGVVTDHHATERLVSVVLAEHGGRGLRGPRILLVLAADVSEVERRAALESLRAAGARQVSVLDRSLAAAVGAGLPVEEPAGHMLVDVGAGGCRAAVLARGATVANAATTAGGDAVTQAIRAWIRDAHGLLVEARTAENLKHHLVDLTGPGDREARIRGVSPSERVAREVVVQAKDLRHTALSAIDELRRLVRRVLAGLSPELSGDLLDRGLVLAGGGCQLRGLEALLRQDARIAVVHADAPDRACITGALTLLAEPDRLEALTATGT